MEKITKSIDNNAPIDYTGIFGNTGKKKAIRANRNREVEIENNILLGKLFGIIKSNKNTQDSMGPKSMNLVNRKNDIRKINMENRVILEGLKNVRPSIDIKAMKKDNIANEIRKRAISSFNPAMKSRSRMLAEYASGKKENSFSDSKQIGNEYSRPNEYVRSRHRVTKPIGKDQHDARHERQPATSAEQVGATQVRRAQPQENPYRKQQHLGPPRSSHRPAARVRF